jgi:hypothetical protein
VPEVNGKKNLQPGNKKDKDGERRGKRTAQDNA